MIGPLKNKVKVKILLCQLHFTFVSIRFQDVCQQFFQRSELRVITDRSGTDPISRCFSTFYWKPNKNILTKSQERQKSFVVQIRKNTQIFLFSQIRSNVMLQYSKSELYEMISLSKHILIERKYFRLLLQHQLIFRRLNFTLCSLKFSGWTFQFLVPKINHTTTAETKHHFVILNFHTISHCIYLVVTRELS